MSTHCLVDNGFSRTARHKYRHKILNRVYVKTCAKKEIPNSPQNVSTKFDFFLKYIYLYFLQKSMTYRFKIILKQYTWLLLVSKIMDF